jgi:hypothetical protein
MSDFLRKNVEKIRAGVDDHNSNCPVPARAILLHPVEHEKLGVEQLWGLAVNADERVRLGYFQVACEGSAWKCEEELAAYTELPATTEPARTMPAPMEHPLAASSAAS